MTMKLTTPIDIPASPWTIGYEDNILLLGSCFSDEIGRKMQEHYLHVTSNPFGTLYNPLSIAQAMQMTAVPPLVAHDGLWHSMAHHGSFSFPTEAQTHEAVAASIETMQKALRDASVVMVTFGTAWVYEKENVIVGNCHKMPDRWFTRRRLTVEEIVAAWRPLLEKYPDKHWLFTVSPIRHVRDGLHQNQLSKATLLMAIDRLTGERGLAAKPAYFDSYEILLDELRDYRFYADDLVHPSAMAVGYIWERLVETYCTPQTRNELVLQHKRWKREHHIPLHETT